MLLPSARRGNASSCDGDAVECVRCRVATRCCRTLALARSWPVACCVRPQRGETNRSTTPCRHATSETLNMISSIRTIKPIQCASRQLASVWSGEQIWVRRARARWNGMESSAANRRPPRPLPWIAVGPDRQYASRSARCTQEASKSERPVTGNPPAQTNPEARRRGTTRGWGTFRMGSRSAGCTEGRFGSVTSFGRGRKGWPRA